MAHSSILTWRIPWTEEPGGLESVGRQKVGHDWSDSTHIHVLKGYITSKWQWRIASKWQWRITSYWSEWPSLKWLQITNATEGVEMGALLHCGRECKLVQPLWKTVWSIQKAKNRVAIQSWNPTPGHIFRQNSNPKRYMHPNVHCSTFHNTHNVEATYMSIARWIKMWYIYTMEYYSAIKNETIPFRPTWMDAEIIILNEISQKQKGKYHMTSPICNKIWHKLTCLWNRSFLDILSLVACVKGVLK